MNVFTRTLGIHFPIIQAPMGGANATPPELVAAVSEAGGLGFIGAAYMSPDEIAATCRAVRDRTTRPFGVNLFAPVSGGAAPRDPSRAIAALAVYHEELGLPSPTLPPGQSFSFDDQLEAVLAGGARVFSFTFGVLPAETIDRVKRQDLIVMGTATTTDEALVLERAGVDAVVVQGSEAGAHRGTFAADFALAMVGTMALVPATVDALRIPVVASGGIMDGRGIAAALTLGASAVQMGTAFLTSDECGVVPSYKEAVLAARPEMTRTTRAFSGRPARGIVNRAMTEIESAGPGATLPYPYQNSLTRAMRTAAAKADRPEYLSLWAGQGAPLARRGPARSLVEQLVSETNRALAARPATL